MSTESWSFGVRFWAFNVAVWVALALLFAVQSSAQFGTTLGSRTIVTSLVSFLPCILLTPVIWTVASKFRFAHGQRIRSLIAHAAGLGGFIVIGGGLMGALVWFLPWSTRRVSVWERATNSMVEFVAYDVLAYVMVAAAAMALVYSTEARERSLAAARLEGQLAEARLHALSAQLHPHFLFNTLNAISALVREDPPTAERLLARLSELLRHSLRDGAQPQTSLESELSFLEKYVEVQETRFGERLVVTFDVDSDVLDAYVPNLILQPLVENAIRHGIAPRAGPGAVHIVARRAGDQVHLSVEDDGVGFPRERLEEGIGLRNTRARLRELYGENHEFLVTSRSPRGTICSMHLPLRRMAAAGA